MRHINIVLMMLIYWVNT